MPSTYSQSLKLELIADGEQAGTWGDTTNKNLGTLLEQAITGVATITMTDADYTLSNLNGLSDEARNAVIIATGTNTALRNIIAPLVPKEYTVVNNTTGGYPVTIGASTGATITIGNGISKNVYCDGSTGFYQTLVTTGGTF